MQKVATLWVVNSLEFHGYLTWFVYEHVKEIGDHHSWQNVFKDTSYINHQGSKGQWIHFCMFWSYWLGVEEQSEGGIV